MSCYVFICTLMLTIITAPLFVLSAMKMEMVIDSPISGTVKQIYAAKGTKCAAGDLIIEIEPGD